VRWPEGNELAPIVEASATLARWRGTPDRSAVFANPIDALMQARASVRSRDAAYAIQALEGLVEVTGLSEAAGWLSAAIALAHGSTDDVTGARRAALATGPHAAGSPSSPGDRTRPSRAARWPLAHSRKGAVRMPSAR
jgi:hypothetical protein